MPRTSTEPARRPRAAFSITELVVVICILGVVAAIAIPRFSVATEIARTSALLCDAYSLQTAIQHYAAEHMGRPPTQNVDGTAAGPALFARRLLEKSDECGTLNPAGAFGPYLRSMPVNGVNGMLSLRIGGNAPGENSAGWHFDPVTLEVSADDSPESAAATKGHRKTKEFIAKARKK
ncbi:MAG: type II secretion system protein [Phycisphaerales bacterium]|nr:type II secretion system protein [Phycisphaerales bacterium]